MVATNARTTRPALPGRNPSGGLWPLLGLLLLPSVAHGQFVGWPAPPQNLPHPYVTVSACASVPLTPDRAIIYFEVKAADTSTAVAAAEVGALRQRVLRALEPLGVAAQSVTTWGFGVGSQDNVRRMSVPMGDLTGEYGARMGLRVVVDSLGGLHDLIAAGLATNDVLIPVVIFEARDPSSSRDAAVEQAVRAATRDAEAIARASGGSLGELLYMATHSTDEYASQFFSIYQANANFGTPLQMNDVTVHMVVNAAWRLER